MNAPATSLTTSPESLRASSPDVSAVWSALEALTDPEIPVVTLRELGILREVRQHASGGVDVVITPTYSGCPAMGQIADDITAVLRAQGWTGRVVTQLAPAWTTDWITDEAREKLRTYGIAPPSRCGSALVAAAQPVRFVPAALLKPEIVPCPRCGSTDTTPTSQFGSTACKALYKCLACQEPFDYFKPY